jgi:hypothetical protein
MLNENEKIEWKQRHPKCNPLSNKWFYEYTMSVHQPDPCWYPVDNKYRKQNKRFIWIINPSK